MKQFQRLPRLVLVLGLSLLSSHLVSASGSINAFTDTKCSIRPGPPQVGPAPNGDSCSQIDQKNTKSLSIAALDDDCTITFYSDSWCSNDAVPIFLNECGTLGGKDIKSFSVDGCPEKNVTDNGKSTSTTLSARPSKWNTQTTVRSGPTTPIFTNDPAENSENASETSTSKPEAPANHTPAIVGGVVGGIAAGLIIAGAVWFILRRRHKKASGPGLEEQPVPTSRPSSLKRDGIEVAPDQNATGWRDGQAAVYKNQSTYYEAAGGEIQELDVPKEEPQRHELAAPVPATFSSPSNGVNGATFYPTKDDVVSTPAAHPPSNEAIGATFAPSQYDIITTPAAYSPTDDTGGAVLSPAADDKLPDLPHIPRPGSK